MVFDSVDLDTVTGQVEASLGNNVVVNDAVLVQFTIGTTDFSWESVRVTKKITINVRTTTGATNVNITQNNPMFGNVTLKAETSYHIIGQQGDVLIVDVDSDEELANIMGEDPLFFYSEREVYPLTTREAHKRRLQKILSKTVTSAKTS